MSDITLDLPAGKYVVAVSGGVDSVVLLEVLANLPGLELVVAHFDHGIRADSAADASFVRELAARHGVTYICERAELGEGASEEAARTARYTFLRQALLTHGAARIITAHHQDDLLETMILNVLRGTGRRGLDPLLSSPDILRPLLPFSKTEITSYALDHLLAWREDASNQDLKYRRNVVRHTMMPKLSAKRRQLLDLNANAHQYNAEITELLTELDDYLLRNGSLVRARFVGLPHIIAAEYTHWWLTKNGVKDIDSGVVTRATIAAKTLTPGKKINLGGGLNLHSDATSLKILSD